MYKIILTIILILISFNLFGLNVDKTIESTILNNPKVKIGLEKLVESKELIENASGAKLPSLTSTISGTYSNSEAEKSSSTTTPETFTDKYKISLTQNLYDAGFNDLEIARSKILYNNEILQFNIDLQNLILDAISGYLAVINYEKSLEATMKNFESVSKALDETKTKFDLGSSTLYDLQIAESSYAVAYANTYAAEQNYEVSKKIFQRIVGLEAINLEDIVDLNNNVNFNNSFKELLINNYSLKLINNEIENKKILLLKEKSTKKPTLDLTGSAEYSDTGRIDDGTKTTNSSLSLTLTVPIFQQGIDNSNIRKIHSQILQSELNYQDLEDDLQIQLSNLYKDFNINKIQMNSNLSIIKASETALLSLKEEYQLGTKTITELMDEESKLLDAKVNYLNSRNNYLVNYFKIKSLEGNLLKDFETYLPKLN